MRLSTTMTEAGNRAFRLPSSNSVAMMPPVGFSETVGPPAQLPPAAAPAAMASFGELDQRAIVPVGRAGMQRPRLTQRVMSQPPLGAGSTPEGQGLLWAYMQAYRR